MKVFLVVKIVVSAAVFFSACSAFPSSTGEGGDVTASPWRLVRLHGDAPVEGTSITAQFTSENTVAGSAGCNRYSGRYQVDGPEISIIPPFQMTMMACPEPVMQQEQDFMSILESSQRFTATESSLVLFDLDGNPAAEFEAVSQDLAGTEWTVVNYNNGREAVVGVMVGPELTAAFDENDTLSGSAGCNNYTAQYTAEDGSITIGPAASTRKFCAEPEGIMEQEQEYLAALESAAVYRMDGDNLEFRTADDAMAVLFTRR
jgi:heat shock protein HslJ